MIDIKQEELDKRYLDGALAIETALLNVEFIPRQLIRLAAKLVEDTIVAELGQERYDAIAGKGGQAKS